MPQNQFLYRGVGNLLTREPSGVPLLQLEARSEMRPPPFKGEQLEATQKPAKESQKGVKKQLHSASWGGITTLSPAALCRVYHGLWFNMVQDYYSMNMYSIYLNTCGTRESVALPFNRLIFR